MRNKLKRSKKSEDASCPSRDHPRATEVTTAVSSESRGSTGETDPVKHGSDVAAAGISATEVLEQRKASGSGGIKIAPIFFQHNKSKRSNDWRSGQSAEKLQKSALLPQTKDAQQVKSEERLSTVSHLTDRKGSWTGPLSPSALHSYLEEIQTSNPAFPVRTVFSTLQKKTCLQHSAENYLSSPQDHSKEKRKQRDESPERMPKRLRSGLIAEGSVGMGHCQDVQESAVLTVRKQPRSNKLSHTHRLKQQSGSPAGLVNNSELRSTPCCSQTIKTSDIIQRDSSFDDVLWTDKYSPLHSSEVVGNSASVNKLQSWLKKWKLRAVKDERRKMEERKQEENSSDSWDCGDFQGEAGEEDDREEPLCNTMLITGPPGVGKTASVYACSQELGFKVFEVNCSSLRSGCHVLSQLKEATQSHLVEMSGKDPLKPAYFNNYSAASKSETGKTAPLKNVTSTSKKRVPQNFGRSGRKGKAHPATVTLANYFKMKAKADHSHFRGPSPSVKPDSKTSGSCSPGSDQTVTQNKQTVTSLILFEEVDVIFDDDVGFLTAIKTFMASAKRPVVLTTNDPSFRERFNCSLEEIIFTAPSVNVCSYLRLVGLAENVRLERDDIIGLLRVSGGDVRRCLLQLQLWVHSGGGRASCVQDLSVTERGGDIDSQLPQCDTGCTASMLGLHPVTPNHLLNLLKASMDIFKLCGQFWSETDTMKLLRLLAESWRRGVPLLYSNLELLLGTSLFSWEKGTCSGLQSDLASPIIHIQRLDGSVNPKASTTDSKSVISRLSRRKYMTKFDTTSSSSLTQTPQRTSLLLAGAHSRAQSLGDKTEQQAAKVANDCLAALTDFFDLMSRLDSTMPAAAPLVSGSCRPGAFVWTGAEMKDGLLDEMSEEDGRSLSKERLLDIQAAVEGLGCRRCLWRMSEGWTEAQKYKEELGDTGWKRLTETLMLPACSRRHSLSFSFQPLCSPSVSQRRYKLSKKVLGSDSFSLLGNRDAVSVDYMPVLRNICRFQREQRQKEEPVRCLNYLSSKNLGLSKSTIQLLAEDFS
uniref:Atad5b n=1 Tax=Chaunax abei TaxID=181417 RepID=A0AA49GHL1_CHAAE|nr:Atad5b [Chaunax abei]